MDRQAQLPLSCHPDDVDCLLSSVPWPAKAEQYRRFAKARTLSPQGAEYLVKSLKWLGWPRERIEALGRAASWGSTGKERFKAEILGQFGDSKAR